MLVKVDMEGRKLQGSLEPSSEVLLHLYIYQQRPDVCAIVHAHPTTATGFAAAGQALETPLLPEVVISLKSIPLARYGTPTNEELPQTLAPYIHDYDAFLLANHGALTCGRDVMQAYYRMETLEHFAKITLTARLLGGERPIPAPQVERLLELRQRFGLESRHPCLACGICEAMASHQRFSGTPPAAGYPERPEEVVAGVQPARGSDLEELVERIAREVVREIEK